LNWKIRKKPWDYAHPALKEDKEPSPRMKETSSKEVLDLIHSDVCGPLSHKTFGGARCFVTFIDDKSRKVWVHTLKRKSDVFTIFKELTAFVETETGNKIKTLRSVWRRVHYSGIPGILEGSRN